MVTDLEIKRIDLWSLFKIAFVIYLVIGLLVGLFYGLFFLVIRGIAVGPYFDEFQGIDVFGGILGIFLIPFFAFFHGVVGSVFTTIAGWVFNVTCKVVGGLRFEANAVEQAPYRGAPVYPEAPAAAPSEKPPESPGPAPSAGGPS